MTTAEAVLVVLFIGLTAYALLGGADFGAGFWDLVAGGAKRGAAQRSLIERAIGPVWEANHVWLIFTLVVLWTGFPRAFAQIMSTLYVPLTIAAVGIILRGAGFAFRKAVETVRLQRVFGATFAFSSVLTPYCLGAAAGGIASGRVPAHGTGDAISSWVNPTSALGGTLAVLTCAFLAAVYLCNDAQTDKSEDGGNVALAEAFRLRGLVMGFVVGAVSLGGIAILESDARTLFDRLTDRALPLVITSAAAGVITLYLLQRRRFVIARVTGALAVAAILWGWAVAQYPFLLEDRLRIEDAAGAHSTLVAVLVSFGGGSVLLIPSIVALFVLAQRGALTDEHDEAEAPQQLA